MTEQARPIRILFIADICGEPGLEALDTQLEALLHDNAVDLCVANAENAWEGKSLNQEILERIRGAGVQVITGGNHTWDRYQIHGLLKNESGLIRPLNYPPGCNGRGWTTHLLPGACPVVVMNLQGRVFMPIIDCPFRGIDRELERIEREVASRSKPPVILVDVHAEASAEKIALAHYLDGRVSLLVGTHTLVQTGDERIFPNGTGFITDAGMTGCHESVIGMKVQIAIRRFLYQTPHRYEVQPGLPRLQGVLASIDPLSRRCLELQRICVPRFGEETQDS